MSRESLAPVAMAGALAAVLTLALVGCSPAPTSEIDQITERLSAVDADDELWQGDADSCHTAQVDSQDAAVASATEVAMPEAEFWTFIEVLEGRNDEDDVARLTDALSELPVDSLIAFDARLTLAMYALDDQCHLIALRDSERWDGSWVDGDAFVYARADTIAAGYDTWASAVADGHLEAGDTTPMHGELLLYAASSASVAQGMGEFELWDREAAQFSLSYESGTNPTGWPDGESFFILTDDELAGDR